LEWGGVREKGDRMQLGVEWGGRRGMGCSWGWNGVG